MYASGNNKKVLIILILEALRKYSDAEHPLTQQAILKKLKEYGMDCDRRSVKSNVQYLKDMGYDISMDDGYRLLSREFDDAELRILIDSVLFSKSISRKQAKEMVEIPLMMLLLRKRKYGSSTIQSARILNCVTPRMSPLS